jgi:hypothetical protein
MKTDTGSTNGLLTQVEAAHFLNVEPRTLESWRQRRNGPRFIRYSARCVRYRMEDLRSWVDSQAIEPKRDNSMLTQNGSAALSRC